MSAPWKAPRSASWPRSRTPTGGTASAGTCWPRRSRVCAPARALDVGAAGGGNTRVLRDLGWQAAALEYGAEGAEVAARARPGRRCGPTRPRCRWPTASSTWSSPSTSSSTSTTTTSRCAEVHRALRAGGHLPRRRPGRPEAVVRARRGRRPRAPLHPRDAASTCCERGGFEIDVDDVVERAAAAGRGAAAAQRQAAATWTTCTRSSTPGCARSSPPSATCRSALCPG